MIKKFKKFIESNLSFPDLEKPSKEGDLRGDVLIKKIKNKEPIETTDDEKILDIEGGVQSISDDKGKFSPQKANLKLISKRAADGKILRYNPVFKDKNNNTFKLSEFIKTQEFGSSGGSSSGTKKTRIIESIQAYVIAYREIYHKIFRTIIFRNDNILNVICNQPNVFTPDEITPEIIQQYPDYYQTFIQTANKFSSVNEPTIIDSRKRYKYYQIAHRGGLTTEIADAYRNCCKESFGLVINIAKWTPSDIWIVEAKKERRIIRQLRNCVYITDLNQLIDDLFDRRELVGISLKKINRDVTMIIVNKETERPTFKLKEIILSPNTFTKGITIRMDRLSNQLPGEDLLRLSTTSGSKISNITAEVLGASSRHGKCNLHQINSILELNNLATVPLATELQTKSYEELEDNIQHLDLELKEIEHHHISREGRITKPDKAALIAKYQALAFAYIMVENKISGGTECDNVLNSIMYYSLAIENQYFECPKYARVYEKP